MHGVVLWDLGVIARVQSLRGFRLSLVVGRWVSREESVEPYTHRLRHRAQMARTSAANFKEP